MLVPKTLQRYVLSDFFKTFLLALVVLTLIFFLGTSLRVVRKFKDLELTFLLQVIPPMIFGAMSLTLPISVLAGCCLTFSRLAHDNEITAMRACGIHLNRVVYPVLFVAGLLSVGAGIMVNTVVPWANRENKRLATQAIDMVLTSALTNEPQAIDFFPGYRLQFSGVDKQRRFKHLVIHRIEYGRVTQEIMAARGELRFDVNSGRGQLILENGSIAHIRRVRPAGPPESNLSALDPAKLGSSTRRTARDESWIEFKIQHEKQVTSWASFERYELELELPKDVDKGRVRAKEAGWAQLNEWIQESANDAVVLEERGHAIAASAEKLERAGKKYEASRAGSDANYHLKLAKKSQKNHNKFLTEKYKRFSLPLACLVVVLLGTPLGIMVRHSNKLVAFAISALPVFGLYYPLMMFGENMGEKGKLHPALAMSIPNLVVGAIGLVLLIRLYRK